jgi:hypothetical protein
MLPLTGRDGWKSPHHAAWPGRPPPGRPRSRDGRQRPSRLIAAPKLPLVVRLRVCSGPCPRTGSSGGASPRSARRRTPATAARKSVTHAGGRHDCPRVPGGGPYRTMPGCGEIELINNACTTYAPDRSALPACPANGRLSSAGGPPVSAWLSTDARLRHELSGQQRRPES